MAKYDMSMLGIGIVLGVALVGGGMLARDLWLGDVEPSEGSVGLERLDADSVDVQVSSLALDGYCPVTLVEDSRWIQGNPEVAEEHAGERFLFAGPDERKRFQADPNRYVPVLSGNDVVLAQDGEMKRGKRQHGVFYRGRIYLFCSEASLERFEQNPAAYMPAGGGGI